MPVAGFGLSHISLILGLQRFVPVFVMGVWGHLTDKFNPKIIVAVLEVIAGFLSVSLLFLWQEANTNYELFLAICVLRAVLVNFQTGSRIKISKLLSDGTYQSNAKHAIWQMKATQGATVFAGIMGIFVVHFLTLKAAIVLDFITFIANGIIVFLLPGEAESSSSAKVSWKQKFKDHFSFNKQAAILDMALALSIAGLVSFYARVAGEDKVYNAYFLTGYGLSVWIAGFMERSFAKKFSSIPFWIVMCISFLAIGKFGGPDIPTLVVMFIKDISYWIILHRISGHIQNDTPVQKIGAVSSARFGLMVVILSIGEVAVGAWSNTLPLWTECLLRAAVAFIVGISLLMRRKSNQVVISDKPAL